MKLKNNKGYSMVELVVVIAIMAILTGVITVSVIGYVEKAKMTKALTDAKAIYSAAQYAVINAAMDEPEAFHYAVKFEYNGVRMGRFSSQSLFKYLNEADPEHPTLSAAKSTAADYYIAAQLANSIPNADSNASDGTLKNQSPITANKSSKYMSEHPETYGDVIFAMAYDSNCKIIYFQCIYDGYFISLEGSELKAQKVSDDLKINNWPTQRHNDALSDGANGINW